MPVALSAVIGEILLGSLQAVSVELQVIGMKHVGPHCDLQM
jgi:hypothetical protein